MRRCTLLLLCLVILSSIAQGESLERENCRLFAAIATDPWHQDSIREALAKFAEPTRPQKSGWSLAGYGDVNGRGLLAVPGCPLVIRSPVRVELDRPAFDTASEMILRLEPEVVIGHLRNASSGCPHAADPHPFLKELNGRQFLLTHNGGVWGEDLENLIRNLVDDWGEIQSCPDTPIDSEYLFLYLLRLRQQTGLDMLDAMELWLTNLRGCLRSDWNALNIILTDGETVWAARSVRSGSGFSLHYESLEPLGSGYLVSTEALSAWATPLENHTLLQLRAGEPPILRTLHDGGAAELLSIPPKGSSLP